MKPTEAAAEINRAAVQLEGIALKIVDTGSTAARQAILDTVSATRGTLSVSGIGAVLDVETSVSSSTGTAQASIKATPANAWALVDKGAKPHKERPRFARGMPTSHGVFARVNHPGVAGLNVTPSARAAADAATEQAVQAAIQELPRH